MKVACSVAILFPLTRLHTCISWTPRIWGNRRARSSFSSSTSMPSGIDCNGLGGIGSRSLRSHHCLKVWHVSGTWGGIQWRVLHLQI